jgi:hypothetical protein
MKLKGGDSSFRSLIKIIFFFPWWSGETDHSWRIESSGTPKITKSDYGA